jgi:hypothetical protein
MDKQERRKIDEELKRFAARNFKRPGKCSDLGQIRIYVRELSVKIEEMKFRFNYVPEIAYTLLTEYNAKQNSIIGMDFRKTYC